MEHKPTKEADTGASKHLEFETGSFSLKVFLENGRISFTASSELSGKMFEGELEDKDLKP